MQQRRMARWIAVGIGLSVGLAACGAGATDAPTTGAPATDSPATQAATTEPDASVPAATGTAAANPGAGTPNTAVVTIGATTYEFTDVRCSIFTPRYIQAGNFGGDPEVSIVLPPEGWESQGDTFSPPSVRVTIGDDVTGEMWVAGDDGSPVLRPVPPGSSEIDSYTVPDGRPVTATGTGTFVELVAHNNGTDAPGVSGSFEVSCP